MKNKFKSNSSCLECSTQHLLNTSWHNVSSLKTVSIEENIKAMFLVTHVSLCSKCVLTIKFTLLFINWKGNQQIEIRSLLLKNPINKQQEQMMTKINYHLPKL